MAFLAIHFSEDRRQKLATILQFVSWACVICGVVLVSLGTFISLHVQAKINLIEGYNSSILPKMLIIVGSLVVLIDLVCGKICQDISDHRRLHRYEMLLFPLVIVLFVLDVSVLTAGCMCFAHREQLSHSIHNGLVTGMVRYKDNITYKFEIDELQMEFQCCGNNGYEDWFNIQWIHTLYLNIEDPQIKSKMTTGVYLNDDVPFSCCVAKTTRACIHHHVADSDMHFNYRYPADLTIYQFGCRDKLIAYFSKKLKNIGSVALSVFGLQFYIVFCMRYLQTSISNARKSGDPKSDAPGWLFDKTAGKDDNTDGNDEAMAEAQHQQRQQDESSDDFDSDHFSSDDGAAGGGFPDEPIYENMPLLDAIGGHDTKRKSQKDGGNHKSDNRSSKKQKDSRKTTQNKSTNKSPSSKTNKSPTSKKNKSPMSKKNKSPMSKNKKSPKSKSPMSKKRKSPMSKSPMSKKSKFSGKMGAKGKGMKAPKKGKMKMPGKKMGKKRMNRNKHNNCDPYSSSTGYYTSSSDEYETGVGLYYVDETF